MHLGAHRIQFNHYLTFFFFSFFLVGALEAALTGCEHGAAPIAVEPSFTKEDWFAPAPRPC